jgi:hypothetical protein
VQHERVRCRRGMGSGDGAGDAEFSQDAGFVFELAVNGKWQSLSVSMLGEGGCVQCLLGCCGEIGGAWMLCYGVEVIQARLPLQNIHQNSKHFEL